MTVGGFSLEEWQIRLVLPHRPPMLQLDRVDRCPATLDSLDASKVVGGSDAMVTRASGSSSYLTPVALIEALAQCCGLLLRLRWLANNGADLVAFARGDAGQVEQRVIPRSVLAESHAHFEHLAAPGEVLHLAARLILSRGDMHRFDTVAYARTRLISAQIMLNFPRLEGMRRDIAQVD